LRKIVLHSDSFEGFWAHYLFFRDKHFIERLNALGYEFYLSNQTRLDDADLIIFLEATSVGLQHFGLSQRIKYILKIVSGRVTHETTDIYKECSKNHLFQKLALIAAESSIHLPENHLPVLSQMFRFIFTWNDCLVDGKNFLKMQIPEPVEWPAPHEISFEKKKLLVNISANKYHKHKLELYSARRRSITYFEEAFKDQFDLYGIGWNAPASKAQKLLKMPFPKYKSYRGIVTNKSDVYPNYRFALCYENAQMPGYVTEKIFDCLRSNCIPIYLGAQNIDRYVPSGIFIDRRKFESDKDMGEFLTSITREEYSRYQSDVKEYLNGDRFKSFLATDLAEKIVDAIEGKQTLQY
jgi:alpha(1,3/1,4) fucosyltransferase